MIRFARRLPFRSSWLLPGLLALAVAASPAAEPHARGTPIERVIEHGGSGSFRCAWNGRTVKGFCWVSHAQVVTRDPELAAFFGNGKPSATLDAVVIRWPSGRVTRLVETDSREWYVLGPTLQSNYHSAMKRDATEVDWSRGFVILDDQWVERFRVW